MIHAHIQINKYIYIRPDWDLHPSARIRRDIASEDSVLRTSDSISNSLHSALRENNRLKRHTITCYSEIVLVTLMFDSVSSDMVLAEFVVKMWGCIVAFTYYTCVQFVSQARILLSLVLVLKKFNKKRRYRPTDPICLFNVNRTTVSFFFGLIK